MRDRLSDRLRGLADLTALYPPGCKLKSWSAGHSDGRKVKLIILVQRVFQMAAEVLLAKMAL